MNLPKRFEGREEKARLKELEAIVEGRIKHVQEAADALREISESKLYRVNGYKTFNQYCKEKWGFGRTTGYKLIAESKKEEVSASRLSEDKEGAKLPLCQGCADFSPEPDCKKCKALQEAWRESERIKAKFNIPDWLVPMFAQGEKLDSAAKKLTAAAKLISFDEETSIKIASMAHALSKRIPAEACGCSEDSECSECKNKGFLTAAQAQRRREKVDY